MSTYEQIILDMVNRHPNDSDGFVSEFVEGISKSILLEEQIFTMLECTPILISNKYVNFAITLTNFALQKSMEKNYEIGVMDSFCHLGICYEKLEKYSLSIENYMKSLSTAKKIGHIAGEARCYGNIAIIYKTQRCFDDAIKFTNKAIDLADHSGDDIIKSRCYVNLAMIFMDKGDNLTAIKYHKIALNIARDSNDQYFEATVCSELGKIYEKMLNYSTAIEYYSSAFRIAKELSVPNLIANFSTNLAQIYDHLGNDSEALFFHQNALYVSEQFGNPLEQAGCYLDLGKSYDKLGEHKKSIENSQIALSIAEKNDYSSIESRCYVHLGISHDLLGEFQQAIIFYNQAISIAQKNKDRNLESQCYANIMNSYDGMENYDKGIEFGKQALKIIQDYKEIPTESSIHMNLGSCYMEKKDYESAYFHYKHSIELKELYTEKLVEEDLLLSVFANQSKLYQLMISTCIKLNKKEEAFNYVERNKSRTFLKLISGSEINPHTPKISKEFQLLLEQEKTILDKIRQIQLNHIENDNSTQPGFFNSLMDEQNILYKKMEKFDPDYMYLRTGNPITLSNLQKILARKKAILIEYFLSKEEMFIFVVSDTIFEIIPIDVSQNHLIELVESYRKTLQNPNGVYGDSVHELARLLVEPITAFLQKDKIIYFVPYGILHYIPIHALLIDWNPVSATNPVVYSPSSSLLPFFENKGSKSLKSCNVFGVDFLSEAADVGKIFDSKPILHATKQLVLENLDTDILHFSTHGVFYSSDPLSSGIKLTDGVLSSRDIFDLKLNSELVTLSACETGVNKITGGDDLIGLTRAVLYAGASSILVSLWEVDAFATRDLMVYFYKNLQSGMPIAISLQEAQKRLMTSEQYANPHFWSAFILVGDSEL